MGENMNSFGEKEKSDSHAANGGDLENGKVELNIIENGGNHSSKTAKEADIDQKDGEKSKDEKDGEKPGPMVGFFEVMRYASTSDKILMIVGSIGAMGHGVALPLMIIVFGDMLDSFLNVDEICETCKNQTFLAAVNSYNNLTSSDWSCEKVFSTAEADRVQTEEFFKFLNVTGANSYQEIQDKLIDDMKGYTLLYCLIGIGVLVCSYLQVTFWALAAKRQAHTIRLLFYKACLRQNIGWFDTNPGGELSTRLADDITKIEKGIGDKVATCVQLVAQTITCLVIGFVYGWLLTLVILACSPLTAIAASVWEWMNKRSTVTEQSAYAKAGNVAEETLSAIRTVIAFGGENKEAERYKINLDEAKKSGIKKGVVEGVAMGSVMCIVFLSYALGFYVGTGIVLKEPHLLPELHDNFTVGKMLIVFFSILIASFSFGQAGPAFQDMATARGAAYFVFNLIERTPEIDVYAEGGEKPASVVGEIEFRDVHFQYPSRPDVKVLQGLNLRIPNGSRVALVGSSGCGKSTTVQLIQRFYETGSGSVLLDGHDVKDLNIEWLRDQIAVVSQEPILFATTIAENIRYGHDGATDDDIIKAAKDANAHSFIENLPDKYNTLVGSLGAQLSGGQKQRIAIARALVKSPKVLLLDEATSALDTESESVVQEALDRASNGRTTLVIAHRLTTVQNADIIVAIKDGVAVEQGTHNELMKAGGVYAALVEKQTKKHRVHDNQEDSTDETDTEDELEKEGVVSPKDVKYHVPERLLSVQSTNEKADPEKQAEAEKLPTVGFFEMLSWNSPEWFYILLGCVGSIIVGGSQPAFAVVFSKILSTFISCDAAKMKKDSEFLSLMFVVIAFGMFFATILQYFMFSISGQRLTARLRSKTFKTFLRQPMEFFDDPKNATGALTTRLAMEVSAVQGATGPSLGGLFNALANLGTGIVIAFVYSWVLTLAILAFVPFIAVAGYVEMKVFRGGGAMDKELFESSGKLASESIQNIRTVQSLSKEKLFYREYEKIIEKPFRTESKMTHGLGLTYGISQGVIFFAYAALFTLGAYLIVEGKPQKISFEEMMITFSAVVFGAMSVGQATSFAPSYNKGSEAAAYIKNILSKEPTIDSYSTSGGKPDGIQSTVTFKNTVFHYPTRPTVKVLRHLSVSVEPGETLALVGSSGCGKSTTVQLVERFYDVDEGQVNVGGHDVRELNVSWLRKQLGIVSQEPVLFDRSIADNIRYGDNDREVSMDEVIEASKKANIHNFVSSLPDGYETRVGDKGTQLSGGQKQRVAIARAMIRNPKILLLDEATSALDSESEHIVQEALDAASKGRTTIVIAHRLSTIQNADKIAVIRHGHVTEQGTHQELLALKGFYFKLQNIQKLQS